MRYFILALLLSFSFSECTNLNATQCDSNPDCEWIEDIEWGNCGDYNSGWSCDNAHEDCYWDLCYGGSYGSWSHCCRGGSFQTDNGYCQENSNPPPTCSEMNALQCNSNASCEWVEDIDFGNCGSIGNPTGSFGQANTLCCIPAVALFADTHSSIACDGAHLEAAAGHAASKRCPVKMLPDQPPESESLTLF